METEFNDTSLSLLQSVYSSQQVHKEEPQRLQIVSNLITDLVQRLSYLSRFGSYSD